MAPHSEMFKNTATVTSKVALRKRRRPRDVYEEFKLAWWCLAAIGAVAIIKTPHGYASLPFTSSRRKVMLLMAVAVSILSVYEICWYVVEIQRESTSFYPKLTMVFIIVVALMVVAVPVIQLSSQEAIASYVNEWVTFQRTWYKILGSPLVFSSRVKSTYITAVGCFATFMCGILEVIIRPENLMLVPVVVVAGLYAWNVAYLHALFSVEIGRTAWTMAEIFKHKRLAHPDGTPAAEDLCDFHQLWRALSALSRRSGQAWRLPLLHLLACFAFIILLCGFNALATIRTSSYLGARLFVLCFTYIVFYNICSCAGRAAFLVKTLMRNELLKCNLPPPGSEAITYLNIFINTINVETADMSLGVSNVNRGLLMAMMSTIATYLVVLAQLSLSISNTAR